MNYCISATACIVKYQININGELPSTPVTLKYVFTTINVHLEKYVDILFVVLSDVTTAYDMLSDQLHNIF